MTMTMDLFQLRANEGQKIIGEILHTMIEHGDSLFDFILYVPSTIFQLNRDGSSWVEPVLS